LAPLCYTLRAADRVALYDWGYWKAGKEWVLLLPCEGALAGQRARACTRLDEVVLLGVEAAAAEAVWKVVVALPA